MAHLEHCRKMLVPRVSQVEAATRAGISEKYWGEIVAGRKRRGGIYHPVDPPDERIMAMAAAVGAEHRVAQILGLLDPHEPEPPLMVELRDQRELRLVKAILEQFRAAGPTARESVHTLGGLRAG